MKIIEESENIDFDTAVAIGMFDGVHQGHKRLIDKTISIASENNLTPTVFTFYNHPVKEKKRKYLNVLSEKLYLLEKYGIKAVYLKELDSSFMRMNGERFLDDYLIGILKARAIVVGEDFRFGFNRECDVESLKRLVRVRGIAVYSVPLLDVDGLLVKSSTIHDYIVQGLIEEANKMLGYEFFLSGDVVKGKGLGRHIGYPTANIRYLNGYKVLPKNGIYITLGEVEGVFHGSVTNVGYNPTFDNDEMIKIETHFLNMSKDLYGKFVRLHFIARIRDEKKFSTAQELSKAIKEDVATAERFFLKK
ncbi:MAG: bifunctional riboflavin kinase/FAD synthetase [Caldisericaceae bacterium]